MLYPLLGVVSVNSTRENLSRVYECNIHLLPSPTPHLNPPLENHQLEITHHILLQEEKPFSGTYPIQIVKGCWYTGEFELNEPFDKEKLYFVRDNEINDELLGDYVFPADILYYQRGEGYDINRDEILLDSEGWNEEQYYSTHLFKLTERDWWHDLQE